MKIGSKKVVFLLTLPKFYKNMRILIIGYGKMGKMIEQIAKERGHQIAGVVDINDSLESVSKKMLMLL